MGDLTERRKALISGATGFIGLHLARKLVSEQWDVHVIVRPRSKIERFGNLKNERTIHLHDGTTEGMISIVKNVKPHVVFHLASLFLAQHQSEDVAALIQSNILFSTQLVEAMAVNGVSRLINTGTSWQHYENGEYNPVCLYAATKQAFEAMLTYYVETSSLSGITLKLSDTYGPRDFRPKLFTLLKNAANKKESLKMSPGEQLIDLVYIDDVVDAYLLAAEQIQNEQGHHQYAVTSGKPIKLKALVNLYTRVTGQSLSIDWGARPYRIREVMVPWNCGATLPGWKPKVSLEQGIQHL